MRAGYYAFLFTVARLIGLVLTGRLWPFTYLARSVKGFLAPPAMVALLDSLGTEASHRALSGGLASCFLSAFGLMALDVLVRQFESAAATTG